MTPRRGSGPEWRFIVPADDPEQYRYLSRVSAERPTVEVILDRRRGERRRQDAGKSDERRTLERRRATKSAPGSSSSWADGAE